MTPSDWARQSEDMKQVYEEFQGTKGSTKGLAGGCGAVCDLTLSGAICTSELLIDRVSERTRPPVRY